MSVVLICESGLVMLIFSESKQPPQKVTKKIQIKSTVALQCLLKLTVHLQEVPLEFQFVHSKNHKATWDEYCHLFPAKMDTCQLWYCCNVGRTQHFFFKKLMSLGI